MTTVTDRAAITEITETVTDRAATTGITVTIVTDRAATTGITVTTVTDRAATTGITVTTVTDRAAITEITEAAVREASTVITEADRAQEEMTADVILSRKILHLSRSRIAEDRTAVRMIAIMTVRIKETEIQKRILSSLTRRRILLQSL